MQRYLSHDQFVRILGGGKFVRIHTTSLIRFSPICLNPSDGFSGGVRCRSFVQIHTNWKRWKVTDYIYSRYCNWVAFLCTSTITFIKYILFEVLYFATF